MYLQTHMHSRSEAVVGALHGPPHPWGFPAHQGHQTVAHSPVEGAHAVLPVQAYEEQE